MIGGCSARGIIMGSQESDWNAYGWRSSTALLFGEVSKGFHLKTCPTKGKPRITARADPEAAIPIQGLF